eukprot:TRINITY_DN1150_c0_g1_i1.p1 TRINITY_DN1150_c0_g1~~TRINITY_DN1150_c0_g1_i1.p1  ORF type:complete len:142 (+),score=22.55 TRINITY_DN1150_c0_g1_i1:77-502(+)
MNFSLIFPMAVMVFLTAVAAVTMVRRRFGSVGSGAVKVGYFKTYVAGEQKLPDSMLQADRHYVNLFEAPVLFYAGCLAALALPVESYFLVVLAWIFVAARIAHTIIHLGSNAIRPRMLTFAASFLIVVIFWAYLAILASRL